MCVKQVYSGTADDQFKSAFCILKHVDFWYELFVLFSDDISGLDEIMTWSQFSVKL